MSLFSELKRRKVFRVGITYLAFAWLIVQVAETLLPVFGYGDAAVRLIVVLLAIGFLPAVIFSWLYELTPDGFKRDRDLHPESDQRIGERHVNRAVIVALTLAVGYFALDKFVLDPQRDQARVEAAAKQARTEALQSAFAQTSIAVLPFVNMSDDASNEYFSDGISEDILDLLAEVRQIRVISRSSAFSFKGKKVPVPEIARQLDVDHVLEGSVRKSGDRVRITAQLIDAHTDAHIWSETYERELEDVFAIQDEISAMVVDKLKVTMLDEAPSSNTTDPEAYNLYLQAKFAANQFTEDSLARAVDLYKQVLEIDPDYARAWAGLGWVYANQASSGHRPAKEAVQMAREATWTALAIDPSNARAYANVGWIAMHYDNDLTMAAHHYSRALSIDPNDVGIINGAAVLTEALGRVDEAVRLHEYSIARDPVDANRHHNLAVTYLTAHQPEEAIRSIRTVMALSPGRIGAHYLLGLAQLMQGDAAAALESFAAEPDEEYRVKGSALALHDLGREAEFVAALAELKEKWGDQWPSEVAHVYAWIGDADGTFEWLGRAAAQQETGLVEQSLSPIYDKVRGDPRWRQFLDEQGHSNERLAAIQFDVALPQ